VSEVSSKTLPKILLAVGWILFATSLVGPVLHQLAWRYEALALFAGPALMFAALILRRRWSTARALEGRPPASLRSVSPTGGTAR